jgi:hypothetical protein
MEIIAPQYYHRGRNIQTAWSPQVTILEVLLSVKVSHWVFHGVRAETLEPLWDWPDMESLLWVFDDGTGFKLWQDFQHRPRIVNGEAAFGVESVVGHYQSETGNVYLGVKWWGYDCPTWELEDDMPLHIHFDALSDII